jgi:hypothetical protein
MCLRKTNPRSRSLPEENQVLIARTQTQSHVHLHFERKISSAGILSLTSQRKFSVIIMACVHRCYRAPMMFHLAINVSAAPKINPTRRPGSGHGRFVQLGSDKGACPSTLPFAAASLPTTEQKMQLPWIRNGGRCLSLPITAIIFGEAASVRDQSILTAASLPRDRSRESFVAFLPQRRTATFPERSFLPTATREFWRRTSGHSGQTAGT